MSGRRRAVRGMSLIELVIAAVVVTLASTAIAGGTFLALRAADERAAESRVEVGLAVQQTHAVRYLTYSDWPEDLWDGGGLDRSVPVAAPGEPPEEGGVGVALTDRGFVVVVAEAPAGRCVAGGVAPRGHGDGTPEDLSWTPTGGCTAADAALLWDGAGAALPRDGSRR